MITDKLIDGIIAMQNPTCVGLDTSFDYLPDDMRAGAKTFEDVAERVLEFNKKIVDNIYDIVPSIKVQIAYYEMYGAAGMKAYYETLQYAAEKGLVVIADAKRNDIGSTASCYAKAFLGETQVNDETIKAFPSDYVTVNGYLGSDGILPFVEQCEKHDKGIFVLVKTSNPSGAEIQNMVLDNGMPMYEYVGGLV
ncbi:MAG: orotidine-5'-phosphate decarboxylase, partial [Clostridia bacterium]|nr:orotidine-5'-phosphate decarboxylase [Clostridia bacterium]